jgi:hypothetical protein
MVNTSDEEDSSWDPGLHLVIGLSKEEEAKLRASVM